MSVGRAILAHASDSRCEQTLAIENASFLGKKAEDQPCHEVVHVMAPVSAAPFRIVPQQLDVQLVKPARGPHVDRIVLDLLDGGNTCEWQEDAKVLRKISVVRDH